MKRIPTKRSRKIATPNRSLSNPPEESVSAFNDEQMLQIPSILDGRRREDRYGNESAFGRFYQNVTSQVADRASYLLIRLPPGSQIAGLYDGENDRIPMRSHQRTSPYSESTSTTRSSSVSTDQDDRRKPSVAPSQRFPVESGQFGHPVNRFANRIASSRDIDNEDFDINLNPEDFDYIPSHQGDNLEPIAWSPLHGDEFEQEAIQFSEPPNTASLQSSLEPRSIQEMRDSPDDLNKWYRFLPIIPTPRLQAQLEYASPLSMPLACYYMEISTFGKWWSYIFTVCHTIQSMLTYYGPNSESFTWSPEIGIVPHHFMDMMWMHTHFTLLVLLPGTFGPSSMKLFNYFVMTQALNLSIGVKTNYHHLEVKKGVWGPGRWWMADIVRWIFLGYLGSFFTISIGDYYGNKNLKVIGLFMLNLTVLWVWYSYRLLLSFRRRVEHRLSHKNWESYRLMLSHRGRVEHRLSDKKCS